MSATARQTDRSRRGPGGRDGPPGRRGGRIRRPAAAAGVLLALAALLCLPPPARADFRHARMGARPRSLGSAFVSLADDANAAYWNPAGLTAGTGPSLMVTRAWLYGVSEIYNDYVCASLPRVRGLSLGLSWVRLGVDDLYSEHTVNLAVAAPVPWLRGLSVGAAGKLLLLDAPGYERYNDPAYGGGDHAFALDLGFRYRAEGPWTLGGVIHNVNEPELQLLATTSDPDPAFTEWALGGSYLFRDTLLLTADLRNREGRWLDAVGHGGAEIWFFDALALRAGIDAGLVTMGVGLQDVHWEADFALETNKQLGDVYMLSFTVRK